MIDNSNLARALRRLILTQLALSFLFVAGCDDSKAAPASGDIPPAASEAYEAVTIKFSDPGNAGPLAYAKREGILERELAKVNARIEWVPAAGAFSANFEAMNAGAINASGAAVSPIVGALSHNLKFKIFSIGDPAGVRRSGIISPKGSSIKRVEDLVGKRVAVNLAAHGDYVLLRALEKHGVPAEKITRVPIQPPDAAAAFATGKIDAWATFNVFYTTAVKNGANVVVEETAIDSDDVTVTAANVELLQKNPAAFREFVRVYADLVRFGHREPEKLQNVFTDKGPSAVSGDLLKVDIEETRTAPVPRIPTEADKVRVANVAKLLFENRSIDRVISVDELVFDVDAAARAKKDGAP